MEKVLGFGGFFFRASDPAALAAWYHQHLGIAPTPTAENHEVWTQQAGETVFAPFPADTEYFGDKTKAFMLNFRVSDLPAMVAQLRAADIDVSFDPAPSPYGRFARLKDPEGTPIELWEPAPE